MKNKIETKNVELLSYEDAYNELISLVESLESQVHPLDESLILFERGQELTRRCSILLEQAELKILKLKEHKLVALDE
jgi:exodeoxyribonuclease VII small subunit